MPKTLTVEAVEKSTYVITCGFTDDQGQPNAPDTLAWTLTDAAGAVVNGRSAVPITPAVSVTVVLTGNDLAILGTDESEERVVTFEGTYSSTLGDNLSIRDEVRFTVVNLVAVS